MQLMPTTFHEIRSKNREITGRGDRPEWNIAAGIAYSQQLVGRLDEQLRRGSSSRVHAGELQRRAPDVRRAQQVAKDHSLDPTLWPSIEGGAQCPAMALR